MRVCVFDCNGYHAYALCLNIYSLNQALTHNGTATRLTPKTRDSKRIFRGNWEESKEADTAASAASIATTAAVAFTRVSRCLLNKFC